MVLNPGTGVPGYWRSVLSGLAFGSKRQFRGTVSGKLWERIPFDGIEAMNIPGILRPRMRRPQDDMFRRQRLLGKAICRLTGREFPAMIRFPFIRAKHANEWGTRQFRGTVSAKLWERTPFDGIEAMNIPGILRPRMRRPQDDMFRRQRLLGKAICRLTRTEFPAMIRFPLIREKHAKERGIRRRCAVRRASGRAE